MKAASKCPALDVTTTTMRSITSKTAAGIDLTQQGLNTVTTIIIAPMWFPHFMDMKGLTNPSDTTDKYAISHKQG